MVMLHMQENPGARRKTMPSKVPSWAEIIILFINLPLSSLRWRDTHSGIISEKNTARKTLLIYYTWPVFTETLIMPVYGFVKRNSKRYCLISCNFSKSVLPKISGKEETSRKDKLWYQKISRKMNISVFRQTRIQKVQLMLWLNLRKGFMG